MPSRFRAPLDTTSSRRQERELWLTRTLIALTLLACVGLAHDAFAALSDAARAGDARRTLEESAFIVVVLFLIYGNLVYQIARAGYLERHRAHEAVKPEELERLYDVDVEAPALAVLVPSYREELSVVRRTLLSAALQDYPSRRVVLLVDDPPEPGDARAAAALRAVRELPEDLAGLLEKPADRFGAALAAFRARRRAGRLDLEEETLALAGLQRAAADWFSREAEQFGEADHADRIFVDLVLRSSARAHLERASDLETAAADGRLPTLKRLEREHRRLAARFRVEVTTFERKRYVNLSREPNKAMNLNAYLALLGGSFREMKRSDGTHLERAAPGDADFSVRGADYLVTLDADTVVSPDYSLRLVELMERPGNERIAVAQTPYSAFPGAPSVVERVAGATTDVQYVIHQGFTRYGATFWVGANAVLRVAALKELRQVERERGFEIAHFVRDRTVIEDTESSVDLAARGWTLFNYPERLAFSATPPDFGSLVVQRQRWANGGLLILPNLLRYVAANLRRPGLVGETLLRFHYLASIAGVNFGLLVLLFWPFEDPVRSLWIPVTAIPYYLLYGRDLLEAGYPAGDVLRVYALNLLLLPVNLGGLVNSLRQAVSGHKVPFVRTPKVSERTAVRSLYILAPCGLVAALALGLGVDLARARWLHGLFLALNGGLLAYAVWRFIGVRAGLEDLRLQLPRR